MAERTVVGRSRTHDAAAVAGGEMAVDKPGDESCHVWLARLPGSLEGFQIDVLQCLWCPSVGTLEVIE
jgi:hypothetical protein